MRQPKLPPTIAELQRRGKTTLPAPGFFKLKLTRGAPWTPALIWQPCPMLLPEALPADPEYWCLPTEPERWLMATIGDKGADPLQVWERGQRIEAREYHHRMALRKWAQTYAPEQPEAKPQQKVDLTQLPAIL